MKELKISVFKLFSKNEIRLFTKSFETVSKYMILFYTKREFMISVTLLKSLSGLKINSDAGIPTF